MKSIVGLALPAALMYLVVLAMVVASLARSGVFELHMTQLELERLQQRQDAEAALAGLQRVLPSLTGEVEEGAYLCAGSDPRTYCTSHELPEPAGIAAGLTIGIEVGPVLPPAAGAALAGNSLRAWRFRRFDLHAVPPGHGSAGFSEQWWLREPALR